MPIKLVNSSEIALSLSAAFRNCETKGGENFRWADLAQKTGKRNEMLVSNDIIAWNQNQKWSAIAHSNG
jgi:hypothetical protein